MNYYASFVELVEFSCQAANLLHDILNNYNKDQLQEKMKEMHNIEHTGDESRHKMIRRLAKEFITPIEREDIMAMADAIDNVTDTIEDVLFRFYICNISEVKPHAIRFTELIVNCCKALRVALKEFYNFRRSQTLHEMLVEINQLEEEGDRLYIEALRDLYVTSKDALEVVAWEQTYEYMEKCCDACEDVADVIESVVMKNT